MYFCRFSVAGHGSNYVVFVTCEGGVFVILGMFVWSIGGRVRPGRYPELAQDVESKTEHQQFLLSVRKGKQVHSLIE